MQVPEAARPAVSHFYKYSSPAFLERLKVIILEHRLYLPTLDQLNDPMDGRPKLAALSEDEVFSFLAEAFIRAKPERPCGELARHALILHHNISRYASQDPEWARREISGLMNAELEGFHVYSMTKRWDNLSLWAKYAADHTGYCLEFSNEGPLFCHAREVLYGDALPMDVRNPDHRSGYWFFCKRQEWSNEEEVRLIAPRKQPNWVTIDPSWLTRIVLGWHMSAEDERVVGEWAKRREPELAVAKADYDYAAQVLRLR
jgi:hypothetical protein